jgi:hypothetical protein
LVSWIQDHAVLILAGLAVVEGIICLTLLRKARHATHEMKAAQAAALESAVLEGRALPQSAARALIGAFRAGKPATRE